MEGSKGKLQIRQVVDQNLLAKAMKEVAAARFEDIQVILPTAREAPIVDTRGGYFFDALPIWLVFALMMVMAMLALEVGQQLGAWHRRMAEHQSEGPVGTVVAAVLLLLAFVIGLTFAAASKRFDARKEALLDEVNAIQTAYLRTGLVPEPHRTTVRSLLRDYVEIRVGMVNAYDHADKLQVIHGRAEVLQESMWSHAMALAEADRNSVIYAHFTSSLTEVFDLHTKRVVLGALDRIPLF